MVHDTKKYTQTFVDINYPFIDIRQRQFEEKRNLFLQSSRTRALSFDVHYSNSPASSNNLN